ncbi:MAG: SMP-30/gluconolactonase/LRE family protein [Lachnospiraceae bacterium]|nr:SMP-30/gluconolactonase/LRE family protein [Lachnospiraceae bacterium]
MEIYEAKVLDNKKYVLGEGPFYDPRTKVLSWVDIEDKKVYFADYENESMYNIRFIDINERVGALVPTKNPGEYLACATLGLYLVKVNSARKISVKESSEKERSEKESSVEERSVEESSEKEASEAKKFYMSTTSIYEPYQRSNDAKADAQGRLYLGSIVFDKSYEKKGNLYIVEDKNVKIVQKDTKLANGLAWSGDKKRFFFADSVDKTVYAYDYDEKTGELKNRKPLFKPEVGIPDGMCIDSEDNLWVAIWGGRCVEKRSTVTGELLGKVNVDAEKVSCTCFAGDKFDKLIISTSGENCEGEHDGKFFICDVNITGPAPDYFTV